MKNNFSIKRIKNSANQFDEKIKILFTLLDDNKNYSYNLIEKFLKNYKNKINFNKIKLNYNQVIILKNLKKKRINNKILTLFILLKKKQTYINCFFSGKKILHNTNGVVIKKNGILEKSRKKDFKSSILNLNTSINFLKSFFLKNKLSIIVNIKKIKPYLSKINKILKNEFNNENVTYIITPEISFNKKIFKKVKSIKRRLRKKYNLIDV